MFDVGFSELLLLAIVALVVLGPEKLPHAARIAGAWVGRIRRTITTMQSEIEREVAAQEVRTKLEKQLGAAGAAGFVQELQEERKELEATWAEAQKSLEDSPADAPSPPIPALPGTPLPPVLPEVARPLDEVEVDGEKAYREWLDAQRSNRIAPPGTNSSTKGPSSS